MIGLSIQISLSFSELMNLLTQARSELQFSRSFLLSSQFLGFFCVLSSFSGSIRYREGLPFRPYNMSTPSWPALIGFLLTHWQASIKNCRLECSKTNKHLSSKVGANSIMKIDAQEFDPLSRHQYPQAICFLKKNINSWIISWELSVFLSRTLPSPPEPTLDTSQTSTNTNKSLPILSDNPLQVQIPALPQDSPSTI